LLIDSPPKRKGNLILKTTTKLPIDTFESDNLVLGAGEYEIEGVRVRGIELPEESKKDLVKTIYSAELDGMHMAFLLDLNTEPPGDALDQLGEVDLLFFSADTSKLKAKQLISLIKQIDPSVILPVGDKTAKTLMEEMGQKVKAEEKLTIKRKDLMKEGMTNKLIWLKSK